MPAGSATIPMLENAEITANTLPSAVTGYTSPYPTVVNAAAAHQTLLIIEPKASGCCSASNKYIKVDDIKSTVEEIAIANKSSCFLSDIASKTFFKAVEYLPILITLNNLINLNNLSKKVSLTPEIKKGRIAIKSIKVQKLNM